MAWNHRQSVNRRSVPQFGQILDDDDLPIYTGREGGRKPAGTQKAAKARPDSQAAGRKTKTTRILEFDAGAGASSRRPSTKPSAAEQQPNKAEIEAARCERSGRAWAQTCSVKGDIKGGFRDGKPVRPATGHQRVCRSPAPNGLPKGGGAAGVAGGRGGAGGQAGGRRRRARSIDQSRKQKRAGRRDRGINRGREGINKGACSAPARERRAHHGPRTQETTLRPTTAYVSRAAAAGTIVAAPPRVPIQNL
ncbi:hypothetical protein B0H17DRAFT_1143753 [Mycena rosella]|uniref:Uncharacterized protein n=1 Tax=Mycena rosella TaxID=1033263 RepID=A0AAD7CUU2_MYCRO|nr:hypothetical protein B0H17DRAFT_1143753 [Mycena rosella]